MATTKTDDWSIDFLEARPDAPADALALQLREARNVVSSYSHGVDFLAEALQNAADAIDIRRRRAPEEDRELVPARIHIAFDCLRRRFSVTDTGIGMSKKDLDLVLTPNVTLKSGREARAGTQRSRGHKGVGLSFLALASNHLQLRTCDGRARFDVVVHGGERWISSDGESAKPMANATASDPDTELGSETYTTVTVAEFDSEDLDDDIFELTLEELVWRLRTVTAVGNTKPLFAGVDQLPPDEHIDVTIDYTNADRRSTKGHRIPYRYASIEELVPTARRVDFNKLDDVSEGARLLSEVRGKAVRYAAPWTSASGREIFVYGFAMDGRDVDQVRANRAKHRQFFPAEWQGTFVATRDMPTRVQLDHDLIQPRAFRRRLLLVLQDDELQLDVGRKTLTGPTTRMLRSILKKVWEDDLQRVVSRLQPLGSSPDRELLKAIAQRARSSDDLQADVPYLKVPSDAMGVLALFHELVAHRNGYIPALHTLKTGVRRADTDSLVVVDADDPDEQPRHVLFAFSGPELLKELVREDGSAETADLAVVWALRPKTLAKQGIEATAVEPGRDGATHELGLFHYAGLARLRVIELSTAVRERR
jgi:Histidine kinase-, DNA gyrase B-, and HSP90-like ATPase